MIKKSAIVILLLMVQLAARAQQTYQLDIKKSKIIWDNRKIMGGHHGYILFASGTLNYLANGEPETGTFSIDMNSMHATDDEKPAGNLKVEKELRTPGYFNIDKFPTATMRVKTIARIAVSTNYKVTGDLTIKGITKPIEFIASIKPKGNQLIATADIEVDRLQWNIDMQQQPKQWNVFDALKNKVIASNIAVKLNLVFVKQ